jgi:hypothetical protein
MRCSYLGRHDNEVAVLVASVRPGRPRPTRLLLLEALRRRERSEYHQGTLGTRRS